MIYWFINYSKNDLLVQCNNLFNAHKMMSKMIYSKKFMVYSSFESRDGPFEPDVRSF